MVAALATGPEHSLGYSINFHAGMYAMAEKYDLKHLKNLAKKKFVEALHRLKPGVEVGIPGHQTLTRVLEVACFIYSSTLESDRDLRDLVVGYVARNLHWFLALQQFKAFRAANTDFFMEVMAGKESICSQCKKNAAREKECDSLGPREKERKSLGPAWW